MGVEGVVLPLAAPRDWAGRHHATRGLYPRVVHCADTESAWLIKSICVVMMATGGSPGAVQVGM